MADRIDTGSSARPTLADAFALAFIMACVSAAMWPALSRPDLLLAGHDVVLPYNSEINNRFALARGQLPLWNPFALSGLPALADFQNGFLYPPNVLLRFLTPESMLTWSVTLHLWLGGTGTYVLCRSIGVSRPAATMGGLAVALGGAVTPRILAGMLHFISGIAWIPWALLLARRALNSDRLRPHTGLVVVVAVQYVAGYAQIFVYTVAAVGARFLWWAAVDSPKRRLILRRLGQAGVALGLTLALAAGLIAVQAVPGVQFLREMGRSAGIEYQQAARWSLDPRDLLALWYPRAFAVAGRPFHEDSGALLWEKSAYLGMVIPLLAIIGSIGWRRNSEVRFLGCLALLTLLFALGPYLPFFQLHHLVLGGFRYPGRLLPIFAVAVAVLGAVGLDSLARWARNKESRRHAWLAAGAIALAIATPAAFDVVARLGSGRSANLPLGTPWWIPAAALIAIFTLPALARLNRAWLSSAALVTLVVALDLVTFARHFVVLGDPPRQSDLVDYLRADSVSRVVSACEEGYSALRPMNPPIPMVDGLNPAFLRTYAQFTQLTHGDPVTGSYRQAPTVWTDAPERMDLLALLNATHMVKCTPYRSDQFALLERVDGILIYRFTEAMPRAYWACEIDRVESEEAAIERLSDRRRDARRRTVVQRGSEPAPGTAPAACEPSAGMRVVRRDTPAGELTVDVEPGHSGLLVMSEPYFSGRRIRIDGVDAPALRANMAFTAVDVWPGSQRVELSYDARPVILGGMVSLATVVLLAVLAIIRHRRRPPLV
jgi:hypothetical protein